jgi:hypothetical protein
MGRMKRRKTNHERVVECIRAEPDITPKQAASKTGLSLSETYRAIGHAWKIGSLSGFKRGLRSNYVVTILIRGRQNIPFHRGDDFNQLELVGSMFKIVSLLPNGLPYMIVPKEDHIQIEMEIHGPSRIEATMCTRLSLEKIWLCEDIVIAHKE